MSLRGRRVVVTGADGFIGSHLVERLVVEGADVRAFCLYNSNGSYGWLDALSADVQGEIDFHLGDVRDLGCVQEAIAGAEVVLHLAALVAIPHSYVAPSSFIDTNVVGTFNVLEAARTMGVDRLVHTSTSEVYGTPASLPITETHPLQGQSPYSATKIAADKLVEAWVCSFSVPAVTLRPFNTYGPRQSTRAVIPTVLGQLLAGAEEIRIGSLEPRRDFTYVSDTVDGFIRAATAPVGAGEVIQLGSGEAVSVGELVDLAQKVTGRSARIVQEEARLRPERSEVLVLQSDPRRAGELLGWRASVSLDEGLERTAAWLAGRMDRARAARYQR